MYENFHTKHSVLTAPDGHMPYIIHREREREREYMRIKDPVVHVRFRWLWKHQNSPACTKTGRDFSVEGGLYTEEEEEDSLL